MWYSIKMTKLKEFDRKDQDKCLGCDWIIDQSKLVPDDDANVPDCMYVVKCPKCGERYVRLKRIQ